jgi:nuclease HARBI1
VWGFIDGTLRHTCRPTYFQKQMYSGHKRTHGLKFQSVVTPDGMFACMYGVVNGNRHDSFMLHQSELLPRLRDLMPAGIPGGGAGGAENNNTVYSLYADPAYPQSAYIFGGFHQPAPGSREALWNSNMSSVRESVEWGFQYINQHWAFVNFRAGLKMYESPVGKYYIVATFLSNLRTCFYGNQTMSFFYCAEDSMSIDEYLALID